MIVRYFDICGIVDHHCLNFLFIIVIQLVQIHYQIVSELVLIYRHMTLVYQLFLGIELTLDLNKQGNILIHLDDLHISSCQNKLFHVSCIGRKPRIT